MSDKVYVGDVGTEIIVDCGQAITGATGTTLEVEKPDGTEKSWTATIYGTNYLKYTIQTDDLDIAGVYKVQSKLTLGGWTGKGETDKFRVYAAHN
jgi:hypothetical protein